MNLFIDDHTTIIIENEAFEGVLRVAECLAKDIALITSVTPLIKSIPTKTPSIICATIGHSPLIDKWDKDQKLDINKIIDKRECFLITFIGSDLVIVGSDKRGTIRSIRARQEYFY